MDERTTNNVNTWSVKFTNHQSEMLCITWRGALDGCISTVTRGCCGFIQSLTWGNFLLHRLVQLFLKSILFVKYYILCAMNTSVCCEMSNSQPWCLWFSCFLLLHRFSTYCCPSGNDCESEPVRTHAPEIKWFFFLMNGFKITTITIYIIVCVAWTHQLLFLCEISSGGFCSLGSFESLLHQSGVWCDWWSHSGGLCLGGGPCWGAVVWSLLAPLSKPLQERLYT